MPCPPFLTGRHPQPDRSLPRLVEGEEQPQGSAPSPRGRRADHRGPACQIAPAKSWKASCCAAPCPGNPIGPFSPVYSSNSIRIATLSSIFTDFSHSILRPMLTELPLGNGFSVCPGRVNRTFVGRLKPTDCGDCRMVTGLAVGSTPTSPKAPASVFRRGGFTHSLRFGLVSTGPAPIRARKRQRVCSVGEDSLARASGSYQRAQRHTSPKRQRVCSVGEDSLACAGARINGPSAHTSPKRQRVCSVGEDSLAGALGSHRRAQRPYEPEAPASVFRRGGFTLLALRARINGPSAHTSPKRQRVDRPGRGWRAPEHSPRWPLGWDSPRIPACSGQRHDPGPVTSLKSPIVPGFPWWVSPTLQPSNRGLRARCVVVRERCGTAALGCSRSAFALS